MNKTPQIIWIIIILGLLVPSAAGKFFLNLASGLIVFFLFLPLIITAMVWIGWKIFQSKLQQCESCKTNYSKTLSMCPICGEQSKDLDLSSIPASSVVIDVKPKD